jgi:hypothetical protein
MPMLFTPRVAWPKGTERLWRCEIVWQSGYLRSEFRVVATPPGAKRGKVIATSPPFKYLFKDQVDLPLPQFAAPVRELASMLESQGWAPVARGGRWYSFRFVWKRDGTPPGA